MISLELDDRSEWCPLSKDHLEDPSVPGSWRGSHCECYWAEKDRCCWCNLRRQVTFMVKVRVRGWKWALKNTLLP